MPLLHHKTDRWTLSFTLMVLLVQLALFCFVDRLWVLALAVALFFPIQSIAIACNHYHHHWNIFRVPLLNRLYEIILFFQTGTPPFLLTLHHNLGHHAHYLDPQHDTMGWQRADGSAMHYLEYIARNTARIFSETLAIGQRYPRILRKYKRMTVICLLPLAVLLYLDLLKTLLVFLLPMGLMLANVIRIGYHQHAELALESHLTASHNNAGVLYNLLTFNSGYHTAHHIKPRLHWSQLPAYHQEIGAHISNGLVTNDDGPGR